MADVFTKAKRSEVMSRIRGRGNRDTELALAKLLRTHGLSGWRRHRLLRATVESLWLRVEGKRITGWRRHVEIRGRAAWPRGRNHPLRAQGTQRKDGAARQHRPTFRVRPDFVFPKLRLAVFVDGCFWHSCPVHATKPRPNATFWQRKLAGTLRAMRW